jgi:hypothetical protein
MSDFASLAKLIELHALHLEVRNALASKCVSTFIVIRRPREIGK